MGSMDIAIAYNQRVREMLAQREAEAAAVQAQAQGSQIPSAAGQIGGTYLGTKIPTWLGFGADKAAAAETVTPVAEATTPFMGVGALPAAAIAATTYLGGKSILDALKGEKDNSLAGKYGRLSAGIATGGLSELARHFLGDQDKWKTEGNRLKELASSGYSIPQSLIDSMPTSGRKNLLNTSVANDFVGFTPTKDWVNNKFATSRSEGDLRPEDVVNYGAFAEKFGKNYFDIPLAQRLEASKLALDAGALDEHHGTIDFNDKLNAELQNKISSILNPATTAANAKGKQIGDILVNFKKG